MSIYRARFMASIAAFSVAAAVLATCNKADSSNSSSGLLSKNGVLGSATASAKPDPCALLSANEAEVYVGVLVSPPYRVTDSGVPNVSGETCMYRGSDGRQVTIFRGAGGGAAGKAMTDAPNAVGGALEKAGAGNPAATAHRVMADVQGPWDHATWIPGGSLMVTKGDVAANIDVSAASGKEDDAAAIARQIVPRFDHPLDYDSAKSRRGNTGGVQDGHDAQGPRDNATLLHGTQLLAVKSDVMVGMDLQMAGYEKAKSLMAAICSRL